MSKLMENEPERRATHGAGKEAERPSLLGKAVDAVFAPQSFMPGPAETAHLKAQFANGLEELRSVFYPGAEQVQPGNTPGLYGTPTTGEQTAERTKEQLYGNGQVQEQQQERSQGRGR